MKTKQKLSAKQMDFFEMFGFLYFPGLLSDCIDKVIYEFEQIWTKHGGGHHGSEHDGKARSSIVPFADQSEYLSSLLDDHRIHDIVSSICGEDFNYTSGDGNLYTGDTGWHSDGYGMRPVLTIKMAFYLDPVDRDSGALRVIPGSHRKGEPFADNLENSLKTGMFGVNPEEIPAHVLKVTPGDIVVFNHNIKHSSFGGSNRRRMFTINFTERYPEDKLPELRESLGAEARFWIDRIHGEAMLRTAGPERMVHLQQVRENDTHLAELVREHKKTHSEPSRG
ncbi:MAG: phytanoyl-CoA dioxygenase family protein [Chloroflexota bacterium]|nr:phytanoyl-CoA dioxygenase family protein [Chloroflexota bacterium]